jgi:NifU-like protein involved in Fe-S cluster formation/bacterioferritin-associated ferredoxin
MLKAKAKNKKAEPDVVNKFTGTKWVYSKAVKDHFLKPRNFLPRDPKKGEFDAEGIVGSPPCGDVMRMWLKINREKDKITACKWRTFGCASAIAATSVLSVMVSERGGTKLDKAMEIRPQDIIKRLGGLPDRKIHCSVLGDKALRAAVNNWFKKTGQYDRIMVEGSRIIDPFTKVTEADIEEAIIEGASNLKEVQQRTKIGIGYPQCLPEVEELIRFYKEKYFGQDK